MICVSPTLQLLICILMQPSVRPIHRVRSNDRSGHCRWRPIGQNRRRRYTDGVGRQLHTVSRHLMVHVGQRRMVAAHHGGLVQRHMVLMIVAQNVGRRMAFALVHVVATVAERAVQR